MRHWLTTPKLIIALLTVLTVGFALHAMSKAQPTVESTSESSQIDLRLIHEPDTVPLEPGEPEPGLSGSTPQEGLSGLQPEPAVEALRASAVPVESAVFANYPNPFNPETWIPYQLAETAPVKVSIYAADGRLVRTLSLGPQVPGVYRSKSRAVYWDGRNAVGERVGSGVYFYTLEAGSFRATRKMLIVK